MDSTRKETLTTFAAVVSGTERSKRMNKVFMIGRLTGDPETRWTQNDVAIATFTIAVNRGKDRSGNDLGADFPRVQCFGKTAESVERFTGKGLRVAIEGKIRTGSYTNQKGDKIYTTDINADRVEFLDWKERTNAEEESGREQEIRAAEQMGFEAVTDEELPF